MIIKKNQPCPSTIHTDTSMMSYQSLIIVFTFMSIRKKYLDELEIKDTTESDISASYLDILLNIISNDRLTKFYVI
jgi:hypothetical protein